MFTGLSGCGKSSLAFDTIYAEGQRRYVESLSSYARQFLGQMDKPDVDFIEGLSPAISIDQKSASRNPDRRWAPSPRSTTTCACCTPGSGCPTAPRRHRGAAPDASADRRPDPGAARRYPIPGPGAGRAGPQGRVPEPARGAAGPGLRPGPDRRRGLRAFRPARSWPATRSTPSRWWSTAWSSGRGSSGGSPTRWRRRCGWPTGWPRCSWSPRDGRAAARRRHPDLQPAPGLPDVRPVVRRAGAPQLQFQLAVRGLPDVRRVGHPLRGGSRPGGA